MDQRTLELEMVQIGKEHAESSHETAEQKGHASSNPYASAIHRRFVEPLAKMVKEKYTDAAVMRGRTGRIKVLMGGLDPLVVAYLTTRTILNILVPSPETTGTVLASKIGSTIYGEVLLRKFESINPALFHVLTRDLKRRMSKDERHRVRVFRHEAQQHGIEVPEWSTSDKVLVGLAVLREAEGLGLIVRRTLAAKGKTVDYIDLDPRIRGLLDKIKEFVSLTVPMHMPCVERPKPWISANEGGWHTPEMRRVDPSCITSESFVNEDDVPEYVRNQLTRLQDTPWQINRRVLEAVRTVSRHFDVGEVMAAEDLPRPHKPSWLTEAIAKEDMDELQLDEFVRWKRETAAWHTERKARSTRWGRFYEAMRIASKFEHIPVIHFVYQADYRGRFYAKSRGVSPQGSDLQKSLIRFAEGGRLDTPESVEWFKINGANRFGYDKAELPDRAAWVDEHEPMIIRMAQDPVSYRDWTEADKPFQFLAWCFEYADWRAFPDTFRTYLPVGLDGSCNGLQHLSALSRDEVGGEATNLVPGPRKDIYDLVAVELTRLLREEDSGEEFRDLWLQHGPNRKLTKRSVMTLPYGSTRFSCADFIQTDYLRLGLAPEFAKDQYQHASTWLSYRLWSAIGEVVVRGQGVMGWLQQAARRIVEKGHDEVAWTTPNGFRVRQRYAAVRKLRLVSRLHGSTQIKLSLNEYDEDKIDGRRHIQGVAPNFVHSLDAAHMQRVIDRCAGVGITGLAMIHDDYGTTADRTAELYKIIREEFVGIYEHSDPLADLADEFGLSKFNDFGTLDVTAVLESPHFFS